MELSIVIPVWNQWIYTEGCLKSLFHSPPSVDFEVVVVDGGSRDQTREKLYEQRDARIKPIRLNENLGYPAACNVGISAAEGKVVCLLNNDIILTEGWADRCMAHLGKYDLVGPISNYVAGLQQGLIPEYDGYDSLEREANAFYKSNAGKSKEVGWLIGFCLFIKRDVVEKVGLLDHETFGYGNSEDLDFCYSARRAGFKCGIAQDVYIHHFGNVTCNKLPVDYTELLKINQEKLAKKWGLKTKTAFDKEFSQEI